MICPIQAKKILECLNRKIAYHLKQFKYMIGDFVNILGLVAVWSEAPCCNVEGFLHFFGPGFKSQQIQKSFLPFFGQTPVDAGHQAMFFELRRASPYCR